MATEDILFEIEEKMETGLDYLRKEFRGIRTGRASIGLVDHIKVEYYGSPTDLRQLAAISTPDASLIAADVRAPLSASETFAKGAPVDPSATRPPICNDAVVAPTSSAPMS